MYSLLNTFHLPPVQMSLGFTSNFCRDIMKWKIKVNILERKRYCYRKHTGTLTTASFPGANRLDVVWRLPWIQEGDMSLGAYCIHWPFTTIGQTHILTAIWQFGGEKLKTEKRDTPVAFPESIQEGIVRCPPLWVSLVYKPHKVRDKKTSPH